MALVLADRVRDTTTTTGTGTVTLSGTAPTGYQTFATAIGNANTTYYTINAGFQWEVGIGTFTTSGNTLTRDTVLSSSSAGSLVDFAVGTKDVFVTYPAEKSVNYNESDNVGIGTTAPTRLLSVYDGDAAITKDTASAASSIIYMNKGRGSAGAPANISSGDNLGAVWFNGYSGSGNNNGYGYGAYVGGAADGAVSAGTVPGRLVFATTTSGNSSPTERMRIDSSGNVGIGVAPIANTRLYVRTAAITDTAYYADNGVNSGFKVLFGSNITSILNDFAQPLAFGTNNTENMRIMPTGNVGIGTTAPQAPLHVYRAGGGSVRIDTDVNASSTQLNFATAGVSKWSMYRPGGSNDLRMFDNANVIDVMTWQAAGNVGIGTTAPASALEVAGTLPIVRISGTTSGVQGMYILSSGAISSGLTYSSTTGESRLRGDQSYVFQTFYAGNAERMRIDTSGNVGIGTSAPFAKLATVVASSGTFQSAFGATNSVDSDFILRIKTNVSDIHNSAGSLTFSTGGSSGTERMRIDTNGMVGIGTTPSVWATGVGAMQMTNGALSSLSGPYGQINLTSNAYASGSADIGFTTWRYARGAIGDLGGTARYTMTGSNHSWFTAVSGVAGDAISYTQRMTLDSSGNLLVGTTSNPGGRRLRVYGIAEFDGDAVSLTVYKSSGTAIGSAGQGNYVVSGGPIDGFAIQSQTALVFGSGGLSEKMRLDANGNLLVRTTVAPTTAWNSNSYSNFNGGAQLTNPSNSNTWRQITWSADSGDAALYFPGGTSLGTVANTATLSSAGAWANASDGRQKTNIEDLDYGIETVMQLKPRRYNRKDVAGNYIGFVAQELKNTIPEVVVGSDETSYGVSYGELVAVAFKAIQELKAVNDALTARVAQLEGK